MLLMGMKTSFTKKPMNPIIANPIAQAITILKYSFLEGLEHFLTNLLESVINSFVELTTYPTGFDLFSRNPFCSSLIFILLIKAHVERFSSNMEN